jgi:hypothetical protein
MTRTIFSLAALALAALAGCGSVPDRAACAASPDCPAGQYCAHTADGSVCWADAVGPVVAAVAASCDTSPCRRDGVLHLSADVSDDVEVAGATVSFLSGGPEVAMARDGARWVADVPLRKVPFEWFEHQLQPAVTARDGARNVAGLVDPAAAVTVTRLAWERTLEEGMGLTSPAVMADGTVVVGAANHRMYSVAWDGSALASVAVGTMAISAAPLVAGSSVWIGSEDRFVYELQWAGGIPGTASARTDDTGGAIAGSLALTADGRVLAASEGGFLYVVKSDGYRSGVAVLPFTLGPVVDDDGSIYEVSGGSVRRFQIQSGVATADPDFASTVGATVGVAMAAAGGLYVAGTTGTDGVLKKVAASGADPEHLATTQIPSDGVVLLGDGSVVVPEQTKTLSRWTSAGTAFAGWTPPALGSAPRTPMVMHRPETSFVVATNGGRFCSLSAVGSIEWCDSFGTAALQPPNLYTPPGQPAGEVLSYAFLAGADGVLHAVIVDGELDALAPWPKAFHDPRNTNRAGAP